MIPKTLVDKKTLSKFGAENSLGVDMLIKYLASLKDKIPKITNDTTFTGNKKRNFKIDLNGQDIEDLNENISPFFSNCINWKSARTQFNITPPVSIPSVAASSIASLLNPNGVWDVASGSFAELERFLVEYFSQLIEWENAGGMFVFGGTATNMYPIKIGITNCLRDAPSKGINDQIYVLSNDEGHSCHVTLCNWLGIGTEKCIRLKTNNQGVVESKDLLEAFEELIKNGKYVACIILNSGPNFNGRFDDIKTIKLGIDYLVAKYNLNYTPHIHADSVIGWVFLLFKDYDFEKNDLDLPNPILKKIEKIYSFASNIMYADSFGIDFHKTGFCPYLSSLFITKDLNDWDKIIGSDAPTFTHQSFNFGDYKPGQYTLECSRPVNGAITAYTTLNSLGINGIRKIIANFLYIAEDLRYRMGILKDISICNKNSWGWSTQFLIKENLSDSSFHKLYEEEEENQIEKNNAFQKEFYDYLISKYDNKLPWNIGFSKCYKKNKFGFSISALKNYPMSPYTNIENNVEYLDWLLKNLEEFKNEKNKSRK